MRAFAYAATLLIDLINFLIIVRCVMSFIPQSLYTKVGKVIVVLTEPILGPCRKLLFKFDFARNLPLDFSPILAFLVLAFIQRLIAFFFYI